MHKSVRRKRIWFINLRQIRDAYNKKIVYMLIRAENYQSPVHKQTIWVWAISIKLLHNSVSHRYNKRQDSPIPPPPPPPLPPANNRHVKPSLLIIFSAIWAYAPRSSTQICAQFTIPQTITWHVNSQYTPHKHTLNSQPSHFGSFGLTLLTKPVSFKFVLI